MLLIQISDVKRFLSNHDIFFTPKKEERRSFLILINKFKIMNNIQLKKIMKKNYK